MSGNINAKNITSENITVTNLTVTNINGRPYSGAGGCGSYYTHCPSCDDQPSEEPCIDCGSGEVDPCDCFVDCRGPQGSTGAQGYQGAQGPQGAQGFTGAQGFQGFQGDTGAQGFQGFQGETGAQGFQGETGSQGVTGSQGFQGETGAQGFQGETGIQGVTGAQGFQGETGPAQPNFYTNYTITQITGPTFNIPSLTTDPNYYNVYQVDTTVGPLTINLPLISSLDNSQKRIHYIVDSAGQLSNNNLIITPTPPNTIGGESSATIVVDYSSVQIMSNTTDKWLII